MSKRFIQIKLSILMLLTFLMYNQCGNPYAPKPTELKFDANETGASVLSSNDSLEAFQNTVYQVTRSRCIGCHKTQNPAHAHDDVKTAHDIVVNSAKVNFSNIANSRLVAKVRDDNHNCWSGNCEADGKEIQDAVQAWADVVNSLEEEPEEVEGNNTEVVIPGLSSLEAFTQTVYPITRARCVQCHVDRYPSQANPNTNIAHYGVLDGGAVDLENPINSRLVQRLSNDRHHCWGNCSDNANEMKSAIDEWNRLMADTIIEGTGEVEATEPMTTNLSSPVSEVIGSIQPIRTIQMNSGNIKPPFVYANGYLEAPVGSGFNQDSNSATAGLATFNFNIPTAGMYKMRGMVEVSNSGANDSFFVSVDNENFFDWHIPASDPFSLQNITRGGGRAKKSWNLTAGTHSLRLKQREDGAKIKYIEVLKDNGGEDLDPGVGYLEYNISSLLGVNDVVLFRVKIKEFDEYSYKLFEPEIISSNLSIRVKNIKTLINGYYNPQHSAFTVVNTTTTPSMGSVSGYTLLALKDKGISQDRISFKFEILEIAD